MNSPTGHPVERALWFIESHFGRDITLDQISEVACAFWGEIAAYYFVGICFIGCFFAYSCGSF
jgi:hypothetical protein